MDSGEAAAAVSGDATASRSVAADSRRCSSLRIRSSYSCRRRSKSLRRSASSSRIAAISATVAASGSPAVAGRPNEQVRMKVLAARAANFETRAMLLLRKRQPPTGLDEPGGRLA